MQNTLENYKEIIRDYQKWFDTCTKTLVPNWDEQAYLASLNLQKLLEIPNLIEYRVKAFYYIESSHYFEGDLMKKLAKDNSASWEVRGQEAAEGLIRLLHESGLWKDAKIEKRIVGEWG